MFWATRSICTHAIAGRVIVFRTAVAATLLCIAATGFGKANAQGLSFDGLVTEPMALVKQPSSVHYMNGVVVGPTELGPFIQDRKSGAIRIVQYIDGKRRVKKPVEDVYRIYVAGKPYGFRFHGPSNGYYLIDKAAARSETEARLAEKKKSLRTRADEEATNTSVQNQRNFLEEFRNHNGSQRLGIYESKFSVLLTDYPQATATQVGKYVDDLCLKLNALIGIPSTANIWEGKVVLAIFTEQTMYGDFQTKMMKNPNFGTSKIIYHTKTDKFVVACHGKEIGPLASQICWAVAGGYVGRYRSNAAIPEWVRVGTREWVTSLIIANRDQQRKRAEQVAKELRATNSLLGILEAKEFDKDRRPTAMLLVSLLASKSQAAFGQFFNDLKSGHDWKEALKTNYAMTDQQLAATLGASLQVANVVP